jgi:hypothetical protein
MVITIVVQVKSGERLIRIIVVTVVVVSAVVVLIITIAVIRVESGKVVGQGCRALA